MADIFISHVEEDAHLAIDIAEAIESMGFSSWYYERDTVPGRSYLLQIGEEIDLCRAVILLISSHSLSSYQVTQEVIQAYEKKKPFIPLLTDVSHDEFQTRQPEWRAALGATASIRIPQGGINRIIPQLKKGLFALEIQPAEHETVRAKFVDDGGNAKFRSFEDIEKHRKLMCTVVLLKVSTIILVMTLAVWAFFYVMTTSAPLTSGETTVVVGGCTAIVLCLRWTWRHLHKSRDGQRL